VVNVECRGPDGHLSPVTQCVGWAKRPGATASGGVPTTRHKDIRFKKWWARRRCAFAHPTHYYGQWEEMIAGDIPGVSELLGELADLQIRLFALSNWSLETFPLISGKFTALKRFEKIFLSGEAKSAKPDRRFYEYALKEIDLPRERLVFIDDNLRNVVAARALALPAIQFQDAPQLRRDLRAISLDV
jgi:HAD superfamily hydrolase (TIGR01509 family)